MYNGRFLLRNELLPRHILSAVLAYFGSFLNDFSAEGTFPRKISIMDLMYRFFYLFNKTLNTEFMIPHGFHGFQFSDISEHLGGLYPDLPGKTAVQ